MRSLPRRTGGSSGGARSLFRVVPVLERLEIRVALAGNVTAFVSSGSLIVTGDNQGVNLTVSQPRVGKITLAGADTLVNGSQAPVTFSGVTRDLRIKFGNGNNALTFDETNPITVLGNLSIDAGRGSNTISTLAGACGQLRVAGDVNILNQPGDLELIRLLNLNVSRNVQICNLGGDSLVSIGTASNGTDPPACNSIGGNLQIVTGAGPLEQIDVASINVKGNVQITNQGTTAITDISSSDTLNTIGGNLQISDQPGRSSQIMVTDTKVGQNLQVAGSASGPNTIELVFCQVGGTSAVEAGNGDTNVYVGNANFGGDFQLQTGSGDDSLSIGAGEIVIALTEVVFETQLEDGIPVLVLEPVEVQVPLTVGPANFQGTVTVDLGNGNDTLNLATVDQVTFDKTAIFDGQGGQNIAYVNMANLPSFPTFMNFVIVPLGGCFVAGTLVASEEGLRPIEEIRSGEKVYAYDHETRKWVLADVVERLHHVYEGDVITVVLRSDGIKATGNHPFWVVSGDQLADRPAAKDVPVHEQAASVGGRWVEARHLRAGDTLLRNNGESVRLESITESRQLLSVYNLEVARFHNYSVGSVGVLVHNKVAPAPI